MSLIKVAKIPKINSKIDKYGNIKFYVEDCVGYIEDSLFKDLQYFQNANNEIDLEDIQNSRKVFKNEESLEKINSPILNILIKKFKNSCTEDSWPFNLEVFDKDISKDTGVYIRCSVKLGIVSLVEYTADHDLTVLKLNEICHQMNVGRDKQ